MEQVEEEKKNIVEIINIIIFIIICGTPSVLTWVAYNHMIYTYDYKFYPIISRIVTIMPCTIIIIILAKNKMVSRCCLNGLFSIGRIVLYACKIYFHLIKLMLKWPFEKLKKGFKWSFEKLKKGFKWSFEKMKKGFKWSFEKVKKGFKWSFEKMKKGFKWSFEKMKKGFKWSFEKMKTGLTLQVIIRKNKKFFPTFSTKKKATKKKVVKKKVTKKKATKKKVFSSFNEAFSD